MNWSYYNSSDGTVISSGVELVTFGTESTLIFVKPLYLEQIQNFWLASTLYDFNNCNDCDDCYNW